MNEDDANNSYLLCQCHHLSIFAGSVLIPPNKVDLFAHIDLGLELATNWIVLVTVCVILVLYAICHVICLWLDRRDKVDHVGLTIMCDIGENFHHSFYLVNIVTGSRISSGTTASVSMNIYGSNGRSLVRKNQIQTKIYVNSISIVMSIEVIELTLLCALF